jgi:hypothetical protein
LTLKSPNPRQLDADGRTTRREIIAEEESVTVSMKRIGFAAVAFGLAIGTTRQAGADQIGPGAFSGSATLIDFDNLTGGTTVNTGDIITNQYAGLGVIFNNPDKVTRANASPIGAEAVAASKPNIAFVLQASGGAPVAPQELLFSVPVNLIGMEFFLTQGANITLAVYDSTNTLLESLTLNGTYQGSGDLDAGFIGLQESTNIAKATVTSNGGSFNFSIDNVRFEGAAAVPEPASLVLMGAGVVFLAGSALRRRIRTVIA